MSESIITKIEEAILKAKANSILFLPNNGEITGIFLGTLETEKYKSFWIMDLEVHYSDYAEREEYKTLVSAPYGLLPSGMMFQGIPISSNLHKSSIYVETKKIVGEDMICPAQKVNCDDECCTVGSACNMSGEGIEQEAQKDVLLTEIDDIPAPASENKKLLLQIFFVLINLEGSTCHLMIRKTGRLAKRGCNEFRQFDASNNCQISDNQRMASYDKCLIISEGTETLSFYGNSAHRVQFEYYRKALDEFTNNNGFEGVKKPPVPRIEKENDKYHLVTSDRHGLYFSEEDMDAFANCFGLSTGDAYPIHKRTNEFLYESGWTKTFPKKIEFDDMPFKDAKLATQNTVNTVLHHVNGLSYKSPVEIWRFQMWER